mmetsp:Transcript_4504/g.15948  ORF Transcript_4504/g.15948 Transcript_4504/m.15948 type:complete len:246 (-) Transcript_4504:749-1486(-)
MPRRALNVRRLLASFVAGTLRVVAQSVAGDEDGLERCVDEFAHGRGDALAREAVRHRVQRARRRLDLRLVGAGVGACAQVGAEARVQVAAVAVERRRLFDVPEPFQKDAQRFHLVGGARRRQARVRRGLEAREAGLVGARDADEDERRRRELAARELDGLEHGRVGAAEHVSLPRAEVVVAVKRHRESDALARVIQNRKAVVEQELGVWVRAVRVYNLAPGGVALLLRRKELEVAVDEVVRRLDM